MLTVVFARSEDERRPLDRLVGDLIDHGLPVTLHAVNGDERRGSAVASGNPVTTGGRVGLVLSPPLFDIYYADQAAFDKQLRDIVAATRDDTLLGLLVRQLRSPVPESWALGLTYDFTRRLLYAKNVKRLVDQIRGTGGDYTGSRWFQQFDVSLFGYPVGLMPLPYKPVSGTGCRLHWHRGIVVRVDCYQRGKLMELVGFEYDDHGRVSVRKPYAPESAGGWAVGEDVRQFGYDSQTGRRKTIPSRYHRHPVTKTVEYDDHGRATVESIMTISGDPIDLYSPYARRTFRYDAAGGPVEERWFDAQGNEVAVPQHYR